MVSPLRVLQGLDFHRRCEAMDNLIQSLQSKKDSIGLEVCENHIGSLVEHESQSLRDLYAPAQWRGIGDPDVVSISNENWMDYCNGGDLVTFMEYHTYAETPVPEGFLWHTLISLTSALAYL